MEKYINGVLVKLIKGDITDIETIAIVNPANTSLLLGGGVAGRIREKGGYKIQKECDELKYCPLGEAVITSGGNLKAKYVIHAVGPRYNIDPEPEKYLAMAVFNALKRAKEKKITSIAMPAISTGIFGYPLEEASEIIIKAILDFIKKDNGVLQNIIICLYSEKDLNVFEETFKKLVGQ
jgi:O-acetyl-ADP-ribose deacetylase (regulator of RNase III)